MNYHYTVITKDVHVAAISVICGGQTHPSLEVLLKSLEKSVMLNYS